MSDTNPQESTSFASRNPKSIIQSSRSRAKLTSSQRATLKLGQDAKRAAQVQYSADIRELVEQQNALVEILAEKHAKQPAYVYKTLMASSAYKKERAPNLHNAKSHYMATITNDDPASGKPAKLQELQNMVRINKELEDLTDQQETDLKQALVEHRKTKRIGICPSNRSAAIDVFATLACLQTEMQDLHSRTGTCVFAFFSRGHIEDTMTPEWTETGGSGDFLRQALQLEPWDVLRRYEQWTCSRENYVPSVDNLAVIRAECVAIILSGLRFSSKSKIATMSYANYSTAIILQYHVRLVGWTYPTTVSPSIVSPLEVSSVQDLRILRDALKCGACKWIRLLRAEVAEYEKELNEKSEVTKKPRKERSDKGLKRKKLPDGDSAEVQGPAKRAKVAKNAVAGPSRSRASQLPPKSRAVISDSESDDY